MAAPQSCVANLKNKAAVLERSHIAVAVWPMVTASFSLPDEMRELSAVRVAGTSLHIYAGDLPTGSRRSYAKPRTLLVSLW
jgi:hypothetical protein